MSPRSKVNARCSSDSAMRRLRTKVTAPRSRRLHAFLAGSGWAVVDAVAVGVVGVQVAEAALGIERDTVADPRPAAAERDADLAGGLAAARAVGARREVDVGGGVRAIGVAARWCVARLIVARVGRVRAVVVTVADHLGERLSGDRTGVPDRRAIPADPAGAAAL